MRAAAVFGAVIDLSGATDIHTTNERMEVTVSLSVYDITVPVMIHGLNVMDDYLDDAQALEAYAKHPAHAEWSTVYEKIRKPGTLTLDILGE